MIRNVAHNRNIGRSRRVGRVCQLVGIAFILGPTLSIIARGTLHLPDTNSLLDPLPPYNPAVVAFRHPIWVAVLNVPIGILLVSIGTSFRASQPWALSAMRRACWAGSGACIIAALAYLVSIAGPVPPEAKAFSICCAAVGAVWAFFLGHIATEISTPEYEAEFGASGSQ